MDEFDVGLERQVSARYNTQVGDCRGEGNVLARETDVSNWG